MEPALLGTQGLLPLKRRVARPDLLTYLFHLLQERIRHPRRRKQLSDLVAGWRGDRAKIAPSSALTELEQDGVTMFPGFLSPARAAELVDAIAKMPCRDPWKPENGTFLVQEAPPNTHVADVVDAPLLAAAHDIAFDEGMLSLAGQYFGSTPFVDSIQIWWSLPTGEEAEEAENFHRDNDGLRFLKLFVYLTDVGPGHGPHRFVVGSHVDPVLLERRRFDDTEVASQFGANRIASMTGKAGDAFLEDTFGIHKGQPPSEGVRLLLQVRYSLMPTIFRSRVVVDGPRPAAGVKLRSLIHED